MTGKLSLRPTAWLQKRGHVYSFECVSCRQIWNVNCDQKIPRAILDYLGSNRFRCLECHDKFSEWPVIPANMNAVAKAAVFAKVEGQ